MLVYNPRKVPGTHLGDAAVGAGTLDLAKRDTLLEGDLAGEGRGEEGRLVGTDVGLLGGGSGGLGGLRLRSLGLGSLSLGGLGGGRVVLLGDGGSGLVGLSSELVGARNVVALLADDRNGAADLDALGARGLLRTGVSTRARACMR